MISGLDMVASRSNKKLFYDFGSAREFGKSVDEIAEQSTVPTGSQGKQKSVFTNDFAGRNADPYVGEHHYIEAERGSKNLPLFYVCYNIHNPSGSRRSDVMMVER